MLRAKIVNDWGAKNEKRENFKETNSVKEKGRKCANWLKKF